MIQERLKGIGFILNKSEHWSSTCWSYGHGHNYKQICWNESKEKANSL